LERPILPNIEEVSYKLFFVGKSGAGKSSTIARLAGIVNNDGEYIETRGIRKSNIYWPVKVWDRIILFRLQCWDAGDRDIKKFGHILSVNRYIVFKSFFSFYTHKIFQVCKEESDAIVFVFSFNDPSGLTNISTNLPTYMNDKSKPVPIVIGTK